ncbi:MAG: polymer-forming cytoskeletal protein [Clostridia bacterium]|nr:polymer-forming cytoskeletal protein [Clostridia bacterium]
MEDSKKGDIRISGSGSVSGGEYNEVRINGSGSISGDTVCDFLNINGSANVKGDMKAGSATINGSARIIGACEAGRLSVSGSADISGDVQAKRFKSSGSFRAEGGLQSEEIDVHGSIDLGGDCNAESIRLRGTCRIAGMLNAGSVTLLLYHPISTVREIGGGTISVKAGGEFLGSLIRSVLGRQTLLETDTIEGDDIYLEYTKATVVRGEKVRIGPGCRIDAVEYKQSYEKSEDSTVGSEKKL